MSTYGILAYPAKQSLSPAMHNAAFRELKIDARFEIFEIEKKELGNFFQEVRNKPIKGLSVSMPHKQDVMDYLDEISAEAKAIGAVNCIYWKGDKLCGTNTDCFGAMHALKAQSIPAYTEGESLTPAGRKLKDKKVILLGAGGAGMAIAYGLVKEGAKVKVLNINIGKAKELGEKFHIEYGLLKDFNPKECDILINATPVGMGTDETLFFADSLKGVQVVMDIVYKPLKTRLLREAEKAGCEIITGEKMLLYQGVKAFEIWTNKKAPVEIMAKALDANL